MDDEAPKMNTEFEKVLEVLESIARTYSEGSEEGLALREAAHAFIYLQQHLQLRHSYANYRRMRRDVLSEVQKQHLRDMGIDPDEGLDEPGDRLW